MSFRAWLILRLFLITCNNNKLDGMRSCEKKLKKGNGVKPPSTHHSKGIITRMYLGPTVSFLGGGTSPMITQVPFRCQFVAYYESEPYPFLSWMDGVTFISWG